jgi:ubiquinone/menaquinone biosynthesis C-methylase UbiE
MQKDRKIEAIKGWTGRMIDYTTVTEITGYKVTREQVHRMYTRYRFASAFCKSKEVLEVACGSGQGLGYLARVAKRVTGGDFDEEIVRIAQRHYGNRLEIRKMDAHALPFDDGCLDVVILYEAIYYLQLPEKFVREAYRVLRPGGTLLICSANKDWSGFNPSPHSYRYFSARELSGLLRGNGFLELELYGDCRETTGTTKDRIVSAIKRKAIALDLMPKTMRGKELLKRIFVGKLSPLPAEIDDETAEYVPPVELSGNGSPEVYYKVVFVVGHKV